MSSLSAPHPRSNGAVSITLLPMKALPHARAPRALAGSIQSVNPATFSGPLSVAFIGIMLIGVLFSFFAWLRCVLTYGVVFCCKYVSGEAASVARSRYRYPPDADNMTYAGTVDDIDFGEGDGVAVEEPVPRVRRTSPAHGAPAGILKHPRREAEPAVTVRVPEPVRPVGACAPLPSCGCATLAPCAHV